MLTPKKQKALWRIVVTFLDPTSPSGKYIYTTDRKKRYSHFKLYFMYVSCLLLTSICMTDVLYMYIVVCVCGYIAWEFGAYWVLCCMH